MTLMFDRSLQLDIMSFILLMQPFFYVFLTMHLSIILVINQLNAQNLVL
jgi:hypothetical protein